jgi:hypothetical protein
MKQALKRLLLPGGRRPRKIRLGIARGIVMNLDLQTQAQRVYGLDERELFKPLRTLMPQCQSMVDIGANDGYYTMIFLASKARRVVAVEGGPVTDKIVANAAANGHEPGPRLQVLNQCAGTGEGFVSVAEIVRDLPGPVLIKLDVDGVEVDVLKSAEGSSRLGELCWIIEIHSLELEQQCLEWLHAHGFATRIIPNAWWRCVVPETRECTHNRWIMAAPESSGIRLE